MYLRVLVLIWFINSSFLPNLLWRFIFLSAIGVAPLASHVRKEMPAAESEVPDLQNPFEIRPAIGFALLFVILSVITRL